MAHVVSLHTIKTEAKAMDGAFIRNVVLAECGLFLTSKRESYKRVYYECV